MSGPKCGNVRAALDVRRRSLLENAILVAGVQSRAVSAAISRGKGIVDPLCGDRETIRREIAESSEETRRYAPDSVGAVEKALADLDRELDEAVRILADAEQELGEVRVAEVQAIRGFERAEAEYRKGNRALPSTPEEAIWLRGATTEYDKAGRAVARVARARAKARSRAETALQKAVCSRAALTAVRRQWQAARKEADAARIAEEQARKIADEKRRKVALALDKARASLQNLDGLPHEKFRPGAVGKIVEAVDAAANALSSGTLDVSGARKVAERAASLEKEVESALQEHERQRAECQSQLDGLEKQIEGLQATAEGENGLTVEALLGQWADDPDTRRKIETELATAREEAEREQFDEACRRVIDAREVLDAAVKGASENLGANRRRASIGEEVMEVLEKEMGYEVAFEEGDRTSPLKIVGQTPDEAGRGDIRISIGLDGDVDFEIDAPQGDDVCVGDVETLEAAMARRGTAWKTTHWGYGEARKKTPRRPAERGRSPVSPTKVKTTERRLAPEKGQTA